MFEWLVQAVLAFINQYGYLAVFVYMVLETAFILHFAPSEAIVPFAASQLVHDPVSFVLFVIDATAGATVGSLVAYVLFGRYGERLLERYGHLIHVSERNLERSQAVFRGYGESTVFWARMLPFFRALISIPAGLAEMGLRRFVLYTASGAALFNTGLAYLVYTGSNTPSPLEIAIGTVNRWVAVELAYIQSHVRFVIELFGIIVLIGGAVWMGRHWIRAYPETAKRLTLHLVRIVGVVVGGLFLLGAVSSPHRAFAAITWAWNDPLFFVSLGFSEQVALVLSGVLIGFGAVLAFELGQLVRIAHVQTIISRLRRRF
ncbi:DedA family protein [Halopenitus sp. H-Gu1]|uniref:DedA family protein n=1 Tax=Halopenitus sp. H-Gu1 TaxID=3242697 RepID=UPI00359E5F10